MMPPLVHACNRLACSEDESLLAWDIGTDITSTARDIVKIRKR